MVAGRTVRELAALSGGELVGPDEGRDAPISDVTHDSRETASGCLFVAIEGSTADGHDFVEEAVEAGSPAVCVARALGSGVPEIVVEDTRRILGPMAAAVHDNPSASLKVVGVTGTNGKTTVAHYVGSIATTAGLPAGLIGTIHTRLGEQLITAVRTTPEASDFQRMLARMRDGGAELVAVEVSSHGLELGRVLATRFAVAAFTNLSRDHLDFHGDMESYLGAKRRLFEEYEVGTAVINIDDEAGADIAAGYGGDLLTVGESGDVSAAGIETVDTGTRFELATPWGMAELTAPVVGAFNVDNAIIAAACALAAGIELDDVAAGLEDLAGVPGRFEVVSGDYPILVVVDYAHTPEGIARAIEAARDIRDRKKVIALIGAGGDRDREKRPLMGRAVATADLAVVTTDNPRSEDPETIARGVLDGVPLETDVIFELDRRSAIHRAVMEAAEGDVVLILGRGHEPMQEVAGEMRPFDDRAVAREVLASRGMSAESDPISRNMRS